MSQLRRIQHHTISIDNAAPIAGISTIAKEQAAVLAALKLNKPTGLAPEKRSP